MKQIYLVMFANKACTNIYVYGAYTSLSAATEAMNEEGGIKAGYWLESTYLNEDES